MGRRAEWILAGVARLGQLLVWEWRSETYVFKQQAHLYDVAAMDFSPDGALLVTADDAKAKLWNARTGQCVGGTWERWALGGVRTHLDPPHRARNMQRSLPLQMKRKEKKRGARDTATRIRGGGEGGSPRPATPADTPPHQFRRS